MKYTLLFIFFLLISCGPQNSSTDPYKDTIIFDLLESNTSIKLPKGFKRSSRYRIKEDLPHLTKDTSSYNLLLDILYRSEFTDAYPDLFIDTTSNMKLVYIIDESKIEINKTLGGLIKKGINDKFRNMELTNPNFSFIEVESKMNGNNYAKLLKYKHHIKYWDREDFGLYNTAFVYSNASSSYFIYEISEGVSDVEKYLWSMK